MIATIGTFHRVAPVTQKTHNVELVAVIDFAHVYFVAVLFLHFTQWVLHFESRTKTKKSVKFLFSNYCLLSVCIKQNFLVNRSIFFVVWCLLSKKLWVSVYFWFTVIGHWSFWWRLWHIVAPYFWFLFYPVVKTYWSSITSFFGLQTKSTNELCRKRFLCPFLEVDCIESKGSRAEVFLPILETVCYRGRTGGIHWDGPSWWNEINFHIFGRGLEFLFPWC